jgi:hypothetical protein
MVDAPANIGQGDGLHKLKQLTWLRSRRRYLERPDSADQKTTQCSSWSTKSAALTHERNAGKAMRPMTRPPHAFILTGAPTALQPEWPTVM